MSETGARTRQTAPTARLVGRRGSTPSLRTWPADPARVLTGAPPGRGWHPWQILGGPGTGKTTLLVDTAVARIVAGEDPESVLVLTQSRRAATAIREQITERLLAAATELFAAIGIRAGGIDRILAESGVAMASLYSSYGSKEGLVHAYLEALDLRDRTRWEGAVADVAAPLDRVLAFFDLAAASAPVRNFRGCQYLNAATEFPGDEVPMLAPVQAHREWVLARIVENLAAADVPDADAVAARVQLIYDGALAGSKFTHSEEPIHLGRRMAEELLRPTRN